MDWNPIITGLVGIAGILGTFWGSRTQSRAAARESLLAHKRDLYGRLVAAGLEVEFGHANTTNPSSANEVRAIREYLYRTSVELYSLVQAADFLAIPAISMAARNVGERYRTLLDNGSAEQLSKFHEALVGLMQACQNDLQSSTERVSGKRKEHSDTSFAIQPKLHEGAS